MPLAYLEELTLRLAGGVDALGPQQARRQAEFFRARQQPDGGFAGREGPSDLYYTGFGLRGLALVGALEGDAADRAAAFLRARLTRRASVVDFLSLIYGAMLLRAAAGHDVFDAAQAHWPDAVSACLEGLRRPDGGYAKADEGQSSSTYYTFLVLLCGQLIDRPRPEPERIVAFLHDRQRDDGGFVELGPMQRSGTNPTAAAVGALRALGALDTIHRDDVIEFLQEMQTDEGGLRANTRIPIADALSTFTGLLTLADLGAASAVDLPAVARYVRSLEQPDGGFLGAAWDQATDVEYAFYGLGTLALLAGLRGD